MDAWTGWVNGTLAITSIYLKRHQLWRTPHSLVGYMFRKQPNKALQVMMCVDYDMICPPGKLTRDADSNRAVKPLLYGEHVVRDVLWHQRFRIGVEPDRLAKARSILAELSKLEK